MRCGTDKLFHVQLWKQEMFITSLPLATVTSAVLALVGTKFCVSKNKLGSNWA